MSDIEYQSPESHEVQNETPTEEAQEARHPRRGFRPEQAVAEIRFVEIELENLVLLEALLDPQRHEGFEQLAMDALVLPDALKRIARPTQ